jgi:hypothetical protein
VGQGEYLSSFGVVPVTDSSRDGTMIIVLAMVYKSGGKHSEKHECSPFPLFWPHTQRGKYFVFPASGTV